MLVSRIIIDILIITLQICLFLKNNTSIHLQIHLRCHHFNSLFNPIYCYSFEIQGLEYLLFFSSLCISLWHTFVYNLKAKTDHHPIIYARSSE